MPEENRQGRAQPPHCVLCNAGACGTEGYAQFGMVLVRRQLDHLHAGLSQGSTIFGVLRFGQVGIDGRPGDLAAQCLSKGVAGGGEPMLLASFPQIEHIHNLAVILDTRGDCH